VLSSHIDGFSLELAYPIIWHNEARFVHLLRAMLNEVIEANGRLYLAHDKILDAETFRQMMGRETIDRFVQIKRTYDPHYLFQSDLSHRLFR
jgi:FAD/FMN-containing dehydrogenase